MEPNQPQVGQTGHQSTPLYFYIQNMKLFLNACEVWGGLEQEYQINTFISLRETRMCEVILYFLVFQHYIHDQHSN